MFSTGVTTVAPLSTAFCTVVSTSSVYSINPPVQPPSSFGAVVADSGFGSASMTTESPISSSAWPILPSGPGMITFSLAPNACL